MIEHTSSGGLCGYDPRHPEESAENKYVVRIVAAYDEDGYRGATTLRFRLSDASCVSEDMATQMVEERVRAAIKDYLHTQEGHELAERLHNDFNWGDTAEIPDEFFLKQGIVLLPVEDELTVVVEHDEVFRAD